MSRCYLDDRVLHTLSERTIGLPDLFDGRETVVGNLMTHSALEPRSKPSLISIMVTKYYIYKRQLSKFSRLLY